jgi:hypothetical protein
LAVAPLGLLKWEILSLRPASAARERGEAEGRVQLPHVLPLPFAGAELRGPACVGAALRAF